MGRGQHAPVVAGHRQIPAMTKRSISARRIEIDCYQHGGILLYVLRQ